MSGSKHALLLKRLFTKYPNLRFEKYLSGSSVEVLLPLAYSKCNVSEIAEQAGYSERTVLNWSVVSNECKSQDKKKIWETFLLSKLEELKNRFGIVTPIYKDIKKTAEDEMIKDMFLSIIKDGKTLKEIVDYVKKNLKYSESWTRKELEKLVKEDIIKKEKDGRTCNYSVRK